MSWTWSDAWPLPSVILSAGALVWITTRQLDGIVCKAREYGLLDAVVGLFSIAAQWHQIYCILFPHLESHQPSLTLCRIIGTSTFNILGALSVGVLHHKYETVSFNYSEKMWLYALCSITAIFSILAIQGSYPLVVGVQLLLVFGGYVVFLFRPIWATVSTAPQVVMVFPEERQDLDELTLLLRAESPDQEMVPGIQPFRAPSDTSSDCSETVAQQGITTTQISQPDHVSNQDDSGTSYPSAGPSESENASETRSQTKEFRECDLFVLGQIFVVLLCASLLSYSMSVLVSKFHVQPITTTSILLAFPSTITAQIITSVAGGLGHGSVVTSFTITSNLVLLAGCLSLVILCIDVNEENVRALSLIDSGTPLVASWLMVLLANLHGKWQKLMAGLLLIGFFAYEVATFRIYMGHWNWFPGDST